MGFTFNDRLSERPFLGFELIQFEEIRLGDYRFGEDRFGEEIIDFFGLELLNLLFVPDEIVFPSPLLWRKVKSIFLSFL
jgi:hypothetical protein